MPRNAGLLALALAAACDEPPAIVETTLLANTFDTNGPYRVTAVARDPDGLDGVDLWSRRFARGAAPAGEFTPFPMSRTGDAYEGAIAGTGVPHWTIQYFVAAHDAGAVVTDPPDALGEAPRYFSFDVVAPFGPCRGDAWCGPGERCDGALCAPAAPCGGDGDCPDGHACAADARCHRRLRDCAADPDCTIDEVCGEDGFCVPRG